MTRNQTFQNGQVIAEEVIDPKAGTYTRIEYGEVVDEREATADEINSALPAPRIVYKADVWRRATDAEADTIAALIDQQPTRWRMLWFDAQFISTRDAFYPQIESALTDAFGADRAAELLAPSEE